MGKERPANQVRELTNPPTLVNVTSRVNDSDYKKLIALIFLQMLPATLLTPAIRPLFALYHGGSEGAMHTFMAINMLGAAIAAPIIGVRLDRIRRVDLLLAVMVVVDAALLLSLAWPLPTAMVLTLRFLEGAAHVGAATVLLAEAAAIARARGAGRAMGMAGAAIIFAVALGSLIGGLAIRVDVRAPFWLGGAILFCVGLLAYRMHNSFAVVIERKEPMTLGFLKANRVLMVPILAAFIERFTVGCIIVTFALFAHHAHSLSDGTIGLLFAVLTFSFAISMYPVGRLTERVPRAYVLGGGSALYGVSLALLGFVPAALLPVVMIAAGISSSMLYAPTLSYATTLSDASLRARVMALINSAGCFGMLAGPMVAGMISAAARRLDDPLQGYRAVFLMAALSVVVWLLAARTWLLARLREEKPEALCPLKVIATPTEQADEQA